MRTICIVQVYSTYSITGKFPIRQVYNQAVQVAVSNQVRDQSRAGRPVETTEPSGLEDIGETLFDKG
jgi:hypothetical protein